MTNKNTFIERRKDTRFHVHHGIAALPVSSFIIIGTIVDISKGGLAVRYAAENENLNKPLNIDILLTNTNFFMTDISTNTIADFALENTVPFSIITERRCGLQFGKLSDKQRSQLEDLLRYHTTNTATI